MLKQNNINISEWYRLMGVDEIHGNTPRGYGKKKIMKSMEINNNGSRAIANNCSNLDELRSAVMNFNDCELKATATNTVFSDGNPQADVMLIGEAPGANEDLQGIPFCGDSGKLLDNIIKSIGLDRTNSYITNSIFWRPPGNRKPTEAEVAMCLPFVEKHIALINPKLILLVGGTASAALFGDMGPITKQRQKIFKYSNCYLDKPIDSVVIFHPSYLMRQPGQKKQAWLDMIYIRNILQGRNS